MQPYSKEAVIFLAVLALATVVGIFCSGIRQNSCPLNELQDFWQSPVRFRYPSSPYPEGIYAVSRGGERGADTRQH